MDRTLKRTSLLALEWAARIAVAVIFLLAAGPKLLDAAGFAKAIANYRVVLPFVGQDYVYPVAILLPAFELVAAVAILLPRWKKAGALACGGMMLMFIVLIGQAVLRGLNIDCGCFGTGAVSQALAQKVGLSKILENTAFLAACVFVYWRARTPGPTRYAIDRKSEFSQRFV